MYARSLHMRNFKCFGNTKLDLRYPGHRAGDIEFENVNLILGDNGGGKSSVLRAIAIAMLAPVLPGTGFVANRLVRRVQPGTATVAEATVNVQGWRSSGEIIEGAPARKRAFEMSATIRRLTSGPDRLLPLDPEDDDSIAAVLESETSNSVLVIGYGATRFVEQGNYVASSAQKSRGLRYQRVAGLFEDNVTLRPMQGWLLPLHARSQKTYADAIELMNKVLPDNVRFSGEHDDRDDQYIFQFNDLPTPFNSMSDGYKAFVGWVSDLIGHLASVAGPKQRLADVAGVVMVDEIDLHLHPEWQRNVVPMLAKALPRLQFILTSHSPLVAATVKKENVFVTATAADGTATVEQSQENVYGRSTEQLLLSSYFGLTSTRPESFRNMTETLFKRAAGGDATAALSYLKQMSGARPESSKK